MNNTDIAIEAWKLFFDTNFNINNIWDARILTRDENSYMVGSLSWANFIQENSSITFGFTGSKKSDVKAEMNNFVLKEVVIVDEIDWEDTMDSDKIHYSEQSRNGPAILI